MHVKIEKMLNMIKAQEHQSSESFDKLKLLVAELLKTNPSKDSSRWITK